MLPAASSIGWLQAVVWLKHVQKDGSNNADVKEGDRCKAHNVANA